MKNMTPQEKKIRFGALSGESERVGCPICAFLREFQSQYLRSLDSENVHGLCGYHTWRVANTVNAVTAANVFLHLLDNQTKTAPSSQKCDICARTRIAEDSTVYQFCTELSNHDLQTALNKCRSLCLRHAASVSAHVPAGRRRSIHLVLRNHVEDLKAGMSCLLNDSNARQTRHAGILGRVAEFLVAQRGLKND